MSHVCPICRSRETKLIFKSALPFSVRSDWVPIATPTEIWGCSGCGHVFKPDSFTSSNVDYVNYSVMDNDPSVDKLEFSEEQPISRSDKIIAHLSSRGFYHEGQRVLDYGCNRGAFLARLPKGAHGGFEVSFHYKSVIEGLGFDFFSPAHHPVAGSYDGVTLIHVLEHLQDIKHMLQPAILAAKPSAYFLIQVPDFQNQISDAYVIDHCSHFFKSTMTQAMGGAGLTLLGEVESVIPGELTGVFKFDPDNGKTVEVKQAWNQAHAEICKRLQETENRIQELRAAAVPVVIYGAGLLGSLLGAVFGTQVHAFVDDNPRYQGRQLLGRPVFSVQARSDWKGPVVLAVPPSASDRVFQNCVRGGLLPRKIFSSERWPL